MISYILVGVIVVICLFIFFFCLFSIIEIYRMLNRFDSLSNSGIHSQQDKSSIMRGRIVALDEPMQSPITGEFCVGYEAYISEHIRKNNIKKHLDESKSVPFKIVTHHGEFRCDNADYPDSKSSSGELIAFEFPQLDIYRQNLNKISPEINSNLARLGINLHGRSNDIMSSAFHITHSFVPHDKEVFILGKFKSGIDGLDLTIDSCSALNSIVISDSLDGIKRKIKSSKLVNFAIMLLSIMTPFALGYLILL